MNKWDKVIDDLRGKFYPTAVGSLPYRDSDRACDKILRSFSRIPFWPQLVRRSFSENMYVQFSENLPGAVVDEGKKTIYVDTGRDLSKEIGDVYERFLADDVDFFSISRARAEGLYAFCDFLKTAKDKPVFVKGQITGPVSFGLTVTDEKKRSLFYNTELKEALTKILSMRARWQIRKLKETGMDCMIFIDEPYLSSIGSSFVSLKKEDALSSISEVAAAIHREGALCGIHCCGNTDWGFLLEADINILSFDAYNFYESVSLYPDELGRFLKRGGLTAWGIVPNNQEGLSEDSNSLAARIEKALGLLEKKGIEKQVVLSSMMITPSCGLGLVDEDTADAVIERTARFSERLKDIYR
ncbi:MAG: hypothetical protein HY589_04375 [Candidatus Omnitrophica bacterium]|nr:hypothetical protein [Candidatus Omnitrophota bacterium]